MGWLEFAPFVPRHRKAGHQRQRCLPELKPRSSRNIPFAEIQHLGALCPDRPVRFLPNFQVVVGYRCVLPGPNDFAHLVGAENRGHAADMVPIPVTEHHEVDDLPARNDLPDGFQCRATLPVLPAPRVINQVMMIPLARPIRGGHLRNNSVAVADINDAHMEVRVAGNRRLRKRAQRKKRQPADPSGHPESCMDVNFRTHFHFVFHSCPYLILSSIRRVAECRTYTLPNQWKPMSRDA